jgi:hypothetical protein
MTLATLHGRIQTKLLTFVISGIITALFVYGGDSVYVFLFLISIPAGIGLEFLWSRFIVHQPGWLTILMGIIEFGLITAVVVALSLPITLSAALFFYSVNWFTILVFLVYILPVLRLSWVTDGRELIE